MALEDLPHLGRVDKLLDGDVQPYGEYIRRLARRLLLLAEFKRAVVVDLKRLLDDVNGRTVPQQCGQFVPLKRHNVISFPRIVFLKRSITKYCGKVNFMRHR